MIRLGFLFITTLSVQTLVAQLPEPDAIRRVNSAYDELNPVLSPDGTILYFTRANHPANVGGLRDPGDIWFSRFLNGQWSEPVHAGTQLNDRSYNGVAGFSPAGDILFLQSHYEHTGRAKTQGISYARRQGDGWSRPENILIPYFQNRSSVVSGSFSPDMKVFVYSAETYGTRGVEDLYCSIQKGDGSWGAPINLGSSINTQFQEVCPSLSADGKTLYFSSNGRKGFGSFDVYEAHRLDDSWTQWSEPFNLGPLVNTEGREWYFREYPERGFSLYVSTTNSDGYGDIKLAVNPEGPVVVEHNQDSVHLPPERVDIPSDEVRVFGSIVDAKTRQRVRAKLIFRAGESVQPGESNGNGFEARLKKEKVYALTIESQGYISALEQLDLQAYQASELEINFSLQPVERGTTVNLKNVLFEQSKADLLESSYPELDVVVSFMKENPNLTIELSGHTDNRGNPSDNVKLSQQRVDRVKEYLVSKGIDGKRIVGKGYGGSKPIAGNDTEETRKLNRRVEFTIKKL